jgi:predicted SnoaL-like aldol condensation-catalyzing enzyme
MNNSGKTLKEAAIDFLQLASSGKVQEAYQLYIGQDFKHHNPYFKGDRQSLMTAMEENTQKNPDKIFEVKRALQDGDLVAVHSHVRQKPDEPGAAVVHICRFKDNYIVELWDLGMPVPKDNLNENGLF